MEFYKIQKLICKHMNVSEKSVTLKTSLVEDLGADSLDVFQILADVEQQFSVEISHEEAVRIKTIADIVRVIVPLGT